MIGRSLPKNQRGSHRVLTWQTLKKTFKQFQEENLSDWAAALTYYSVLSFFPALIVLVSIVGLVGDPESVTSFLTDLVASIGPTSAGETLQGPIEGLTRSRGSAGVLFTVGLIGAVWSASSYIGAFTRASNAVYDVKESRPFFKLRPLQMLITLILVVLWALILIALLITGPVAQGIGQVAGVGKDVVTLWNIAKWPALFLAVMLMVSLLYYASPNIILPGLKSVLPGSIFAVTIWLLGSAAFGFYVANFGSYNKTYGVLGGVIVLLLWLWISNSAILLGAALNSEINLGRKP